MLMDSFEVENFRSLKHLKLEKLARVNLLVGKNNSGKTSVLEALYCLTGISTPIWFETITRERELSLINADFLQLFYRMDSIGMVKLRSEYWSQPAPESYRTWLQVTLQTKYSLTQEIIDETEWNSDESPQRTTRSEALAIELQTDAMTNPANYELSLKEGRNFPRLNLQEIQSGSLQVAKNIRSAGPFRSRVAYVSSHPRLRNASSAIEQLKIVKADDELVIVLRQVDSRIERIELVGGGIYFNLGAEFPKLLPASLMGEGIQRLLLIVSRIISRPNGLVLIDELDNGLHYSVLRILWKAILYAARKHDVQIIATTHSAEALRHLTWVLDDEENANFRDDVAAYTLIRADDDTVRTYRHDYEQLDYALDHGLEVRN